MTLTITVDESVEFALRKLAASYGSSVSDTAARLLAREIRAASPRPVCDLEDLKRRSREFQEEELGLADSDPEHRLELLEAEDQA